MGIGCRMEDTSALIISDAKDDGDTSGTENS